MPLPDSTSAKAAAPQVPIPIQGGLDDNDTVVRPSGNLPPTSSSTATLEPREEGAEEGYGVEEELLESDASEIVQPFDPTEISISTKATTVHLVMSRLIHEEIDLNPDFQRNAGIWDPTRQSRLIESLLLRIPLPMFYVAADKNDHWRVVDGLQRLYSIKSFVLDKTLKLRRLEYLTRFERASHDDLPRSMQRRINETELAFHVIDARTPENVMFNVFKRVNTGGKPLTLQEIRHALHPGPARDFVNELAESGEFRRATDGSVSPRRMADRECVLRFIAFYCQDLTAYNGHLDAFLTHAMRRINAMEEGEKKDLRGAFFRAMKLAEALFGNNAFRKPPGPSGQRSVINRPLFEALAVALARVPKDKHGALLERGADVKRLLVVLMTNDKFRESISIGTQTTERVHVRFESIKQIIDEVLSND